MNIEQQCPRCIGGIGGVHLAAGQALQQKAVDRSRCQLALLGFLAGSFYVIKQPSQLGCCEIGVEE
jgi:hypothetical protein